MNLFARTLSPTSRVGTMLSEGMRNASRTKGRTKPKTSTKAIRMVRQSSVKPALLFFLCRSQRTSRRRFGDPSFQKRSSPTLEHSDLCRSQRTSRRRFGDPSFQKRSSPTLEHSDLCRSQRTSRRRFGDPSFQKRSSPTLEHSDARRRPEERERLTLYVLYGHRPEDARVGRIRSVVPHYEDLPLRQPHRAKEAVVRNPAVEVGFILRLFVYAQHAPTHLDLVPRHPHYALYQIRFPAVHALEDHHVSLFGLGEAVDELVHEDPVAHLQGGHHALRGDAKRLEDKGAHEAKNQHEGDCKYDQKLHEAPGLSGGTSSRVTFGSYTRLETLLVEVLSGHDRLGYLTREHNVLARFPFALEQPDARQRPETYERLTLYVLDRQL